MKKTMKTIAAIAAIIAAIIVMAAPAGAYNKAPARVKNLKPVYKDGRTSITWEYRGREVDVTIGHATFRLQKGARDVKVSGSKWSWNISSEENLQILGGATPANRFYTVKVEPVLRNWPTRALKSSIFLLAQDDGWWYTGCRAIDSLGVTTSEADPDDGRWIVSTEASLHPVQGPGGDRARFTYEWSVNGEKIATRKFPKGEYSEWQSSAEIGGESATVRCKLSVILPDGKKLVIHDERITVRPAEYEEDRYPVCYRGRW